MEITHAYPNLITDKVYVHYFPTLNSIMFFTTKENISKKYTIGVWHIKSK